MSLTTRVRDWQVAGIAQMGGAAGVGAGVLWFQFYSPALRLRENFTLAGAGFGIGGSMGGASAPDLSGQISYSPVPCQKPFSVEDMDGTFARVTSAGVGLAIGYGLCYLSAGRPWDPYFYSAPCHGFSVGVGAGGFSFIGSWSSTTLGAQRASRAA